MIGYEMFDPSKWSENGLILPAPALLAAAKKAVRKTAAHLFASSMVFVGGAAIACDLPANVIYQSVPSSSTSIQTLRGIVPVESSTETHGELVPVGYWREVIDEMKSWETVPEDTFAI